MALKPLNSVGGFSVGETPSNVIYPNGYITGNGALPIWIQHTSLTNAVSVMYQYFTYYTYQYRTTVGTRKLDPRGLKWDQYKGWTKF